jgi:hypothetical protein
MKDTPATVETPQETKEAPPPAAETKISPRGIAAIRGGEVAQADTTVPEKDAAQVRLDEAAAQAQKEVPEHKDTPEAQQVEYYKLRGRVGENLAQENIPEAVNANDATGKQNFANYDLFSPHETASVKVKQLTDGEPRYADYNKYFKDITNPQSKTNQRAAADLLAIKTEDPARWEKLAPHLPAEVLQAQEPAQMTGALAEKGSLRIPGDQVAQVRENLKSRALQDPAQYGLDATLNPAALEDQAQRLVRERIRPIDKTNGFEAINQAAQAAQRKRLG